MNHLSIQNFGPVKSAELELKSFNFLIGEQSSGKSTIAKLIALFTDYVNLALIASGGKKAWSSCLSMYDLSIYVDDHYRISYDYEDRDFILKIRVFKSRVISRLIIGGEVIEDREEIGIRMTNFKEQFFKGVINSITSELPDMKDKDPRYAALLLKTIIESSLYVPAERIAYSLNDNLKSALSLLEEKVTFTYRRFMVNLEKAKARFKKYDSSLLKITYLNEEDGQYFVDHLSDKRYHLINASSGIQSAIPLLLVLEDAKFRQYSSIVIEEPETNLYPNTQINILRMILKNARVNGRIVTITTHSPYLLSALNNYLFAGYVSKNVSKGGLKSLESIIKEEYRLSSDECSVYSIGESINENGVYCTSLINNQIGMIDSNTLDRVSFKMNEEFEAIQNTYLQNS